MKSKTWPNWHQHSLALVVDSCLCVFGSFIKNSRGVDILRPQRKNSPEMAEDGALGLAYRIHRKFAPFFAQIFAKKFVKCKNLHKKLRKHLQHDYFLAFICANICTNFGVSKILAQTFAQSFAQIFRLKNIRANSCAIICSNFWVKTNFRKFFFANICVKFLATY